jgi:hypothetical protein
MHVYRTEINTSTSCAYGLWRDDITCRYRTVPYRTGPWYFAGQSRHIYFTAVSCLYGTGPYRTVPRAMLARTYPYVAAAQNLKYYCYGIYILMLLVSSGFWPLNLTFFLVGYCWWGRLILDVDGISFVDWSLSRRGLCAEHITARSHCRRGAYFFAFKYFSYSCFSKVMILGCAL